MTARSDAARQARRDLEAINAAQNRTDAYRFYDYASASVIIWGGVWLIANLVSHFQPALSGTAWIVGISIGSIASAALGARARCSASETNGLPRRLTAGIALSALILAGVMGVIFVGGFDDGRQINAVISLVIAIVYAAMGITRGVRMLLLGVFLGVSTLIGWKWFYDIFALWMGLVGGGALILGGFWMRRA